MSSEPVRCGAVRCGETQNTDRQERRQAQRSGADAQRRSRPIPALLEGIRRGGCDGRRCVVVCRSILVFYLIKADGSAAHYRITYTTTVH